jgi:hypothetical protein
MSVMQTIVHRLTVQICSVYKVTKRRRAWSCQVYRKARGLRGALKVAEAMCPHCYHLACALFRKQFPHLFAA